MQSDLHRGVAGTAICMHNFDSIRVADEKLAAKSHAAAVQRSGHRQHAPSTHGLGPERIVAGLFDLIFARSVPRSRRPVDIACRHTLCRLGQLGLPVDRGDPIRLCPPLHGRS